MKEIVLGKYLQLKSGSTRKSFRKVYRAHLSSHCLIYISSNGLLVVYPICSPSSNKNFRHKQYIRLADRPQGKHVCDNVDQVVGAIRSWVSNDLIVGHGNGGRQ